ncbi:MAG: hypothetical protein RL071_662 [Pseudomonadota bacterium]
MSPCARALTLAALLLPGLAAAAPCPPLGESAAGLRAAATGGPLSAGPAHLAAAEAALGCAAQVDPDVLADLFEAQAAYLQLIEATEEAQLAQASAARLRGEAPADTDAPMGALRLAVGAPAPQLNGAAGQPDQPLASGFYAVVVEAPGGRTAQLLALWPGEELHISSAGAVEARPAAAAPAVAAAPPAEPSAPAPRLDPAPAPLPPPLPAPDLRRPGQARPWFLAAGGAAAAAAVTATIARAQIGAAAGATAQGEVDRARRVQLATGISSYALMATTGGLVVVGLRR